MGQRPAPRSLTRPHFFTPLVFWPGQEALVGKDSLLAAVEVRARIADLTYLGECICVVGATRRSFASTQRAVTTVTGCRTLGLALSTPEALPQRTDTSCSQHPLLSWMFICSNVWAALCYNSPSVFPPCWQLVEKKAGILFTSESLMIRKGTINKQKLLQTAIQVLLEKQ